MLALLAFLWLLPPRRRSHYVIVLSELVSVPIECELDPMSADLCFCLLRNIGAYPTMSLLMFFYSLVLIHLFAPLQQFSFEYVRFQFHTTRQKQQQPHASKTVYF